MILVKDLLEACMCPFHTLKIVDGVTTKDFDFLKCGYADCSKYYERKVTDFNYKNGILVLFLAPEK